MDRRNSKSDSDQTPQQPTNPNVFDDEYALGPDEDDFMPAVSDGFRPAGVSGNHEPWNGDRQNHDRRDPPRPPLMSANSADSDLRRIASRNSTMKPPCRRESLSNDTRSAAVHHNRGPSSPATAALQHRASISSTGSFATMARSESPFGVGPSHPYGMYPQHTMARSSSVTTSSTQRQPHRSMSLQRPAHPYGMYPQNVVEDESPLPAVQAAIPVGFPGLNTAFHRQIGPDGEEQDIIGLDGHTEQLPPYSRYPTEGPTKAALAAEASATPIEPPSVVSLNTVYDVPHISPVSPLSPVSPIRFPPPQQETHRDVAPIALPVSLSQSAASLSSTEQDASEKQETPQSVKSWRSKKLWGRVPMGVAIALLVLVLIFAIILGAAIGTIGARNRDRGGHGGPGRNKNDKDGDPASQVTGDPSNTLFDATPIPTPSSLIPLPTGQFALPLGVAQESSKSCLTVANQLSAWSCKMTFAPLLLNVSYMNQQFTRPMASLAGFPKPDATIQYGLQPPQLSFQLMQLVLDLDFKMYGPAYHFSTMYDKLVVLGENEFQAGASLTAASLRKRDDKPPFRHRFQVMPGEYPWYCYWNSTYIEGYIYSQDNSTAATFTNFPTAWFSSPYGSSIPVETPPPSAVVNTASPASVPVESTSTPAPISPRGDSDYEMKQPYPRIVKIEERRLPGSKQPYCQKMRLLDDLSAVPAVDAGGNQIIIYLQESDPAMDEFFAAANTQSPPTPSTSTSPSANATERRRAELEKRGDPAGACHCQWMFQ